MANATLCGFGIDGYALCHPGPGRCSFARADEKKSGSGREQRAQEQESKVHLFDHEPIRVLARLLDETGLMQIELSARDSGRAWRANPQSPRHTVWLARAGAFPPNQLRMSSWIRADPQSIRAGIIAHGRHGLSRPGACARPFVEVGSRVAIGDTLVIVEAMKTMNHIPSPHAGTVIQVSIEDGQPVEIGEPLMIIE